jgi:uncharacterized phage-associated protein
MLAYTGVSASPGLPSGAWVAAEGEEIYMLSPYTARAVANFFLEAGWDEGAPVEAMKLQKLVYIAHGWSLAILGKPLIQEQMQAWEHGPVVPDLYHHFKHFGGEPIDHYAKGDRERGPQVANWDSETRNLLKKVWGEYGRSTGSELRSLTHEPGSPWDWVKKASAGRIPRGTTIPNRVIGDHYRSLIPISSNWSNLSRSDLATIGIGSLIDLTGQSVGPLRRARKARADGLRRDGLKVAGDLRRAFASVIRE